MDNKIREGQEREKSGEHHDNNDKTDIQGTHGWPSFTLPARFGKKLTNRMPF